MFYYLENWVVNTNVGYASDYKYKLVSFCSSQRKVLLIQKNNYLCDVTEGFFQSLLPVWFPVFWTLMQNRSHMVLFLQWIRRHCTVLLHINCLVIEVYLSGTGKKTLERWGSTENSVCRCPRTDWWCPRLKCKAGNCKLLHSMNWHVFLFSFPSSDEIFPARNWLNMTLWGQ